MQIFLTFKEKMKMWVLKCMGLEKIHVQELKMKLIYTNF
jgi:hypothetical protein